MAIECIGWRCIGIIIGWVLFIPSTVLLLIISIFQVEVRQMRHDVPIGLVGGQTFAMVNWWMNVSWLYGVTFYQPIFMLLTLIWCALMGVFYLYFKVADIFAEMQSDEDKNENLVYNLAEVNIIICLYICAVFCFKFMLKSTGHLRRRQADPMPTEAYELPSYQQTQPTQQ